MKRLPVIGHELVVGRGVGVHEAHEDVAIPAPWVDVVAPATGYEAEVSGCGLAAAIGAEEGPVVSFMRISP